MLSHPFLATRNFGPFTRHNRNFARSTFNSNLTSRKWNVYQDQIERSIWLQLQYKMKNWNFISSIVWLLHHKPDLPKNSDLSFVFSDTYLFYSSELREILFNQRGAIHLPEKISFIDLCNAVRPETDVLLTQATFPIFDLLADWRYRIIKFFVHTPSWTACYATTTIASCTSSHAHGSWFWFMYKCVWFPSKFSCTRRRSANEQK